MQQAETSALEQIRQQLGDAFLRGRAPHAILLEGGETDALAAWISAAAVCTNAQKRPCGECAGCKKAFGGIHPDIHTASGSGAARSFHVEEIRFIRSDVYKRPNEALRKVYILRGAQDMSREAQNALLKILEEPPQDLLFILTCDNVNALLPTVRSRTQFFSLPQEKPAFDAELAERAEQLISQIASALVAPKEWELVSLSAPLIADKVLFRAVLEKLSLLLRDVCVFRACGTPAKQLQAAVETLGGALTLERLLNLSALTEETRQKSQQNANHALLVTTFFAVCRKIRYGSDAGFNKREGSDIRGRKG